MRVQRDWNEPNCICILQLSLGLSLCTLFRRLEQFSSVQLVRCIRAFTDRCLGLTEVLQCASCRHDDGHEKRRVVATERLLLAQDEDTARVRLRGAVIQVVFECWDVSVVVEQSCHVVVWRRVATTQLDGRLSSFVHRALGVVEHCASTSQPAETLSVIGTGIFKTSFRTKQWPRPKESKIETEDPVLGWGSCF